MIALDPDTDDPNALKYNFVEPITAVDKYGKEVTDSAIFFKVSIIIFKDFRLRITKFVVMIMYHLIIFIELLWNQRLG